MLAHRTEDVWAVLRFALRFGLPGMQGACIAWLGGTAKGRLLWHADTVVAVAQQHAAAAAAAAPSAKGSGPHVPGAAAATGTSGGAGTGGAGAEAAAQQLPVVAMLERELLAEQQAAGLRQLGSYVAAAERLRLARLRGGLLRSVAAQWAALGRQPVLVSPLALLERCLRPPFVAATFQGSAHVQRWATFWTRLPIVYLLPHAPPCPRSSRPCARSTAHSWRTPRSRRAPLPPPPLQLLEPPPTAAGW